MATTTLTDTLKNAVPLAKAKYPGQTPSLPTKHRHAFIGLLNRAGERVKLQTWKLGGKLVTTPEAIEEFLQRLNADAEPVDDRDDMARRGREAGKALEALGC